MHPVSDSVSFQCGTVSIFSSVNTMMLTSLDECFLQQLFHLVQCRMAVRVTQLWNMAIFEHKLFTR